MHIVNYIRTLETQFQHVSEQMYHFQEEKCTYLLVGSTAS